MIGRHHAMMLGSLMSLLMFGCASPSTPTHEENDEVTVSESDAKLSSQTRRLLEDLPEDGNPTVAAMLELIRPVGSQDRAALSDVGAIVQSAVGEMVTVQVPARSIRQVAELDFVAYIEVSTPLTPEE